MGKTFGQFILLAVLSVTIAVGANLISPNAIDFVGKWRTLSDGEGPIVPPTAEPGDPPFIDINQADLEFTAGTAIFIDARDSYEFECGTIPGAVNMPFEYLPEGELDQYLDSLLPGVPKDKTLIIFCSGDECDLSLHLARNLLDYQYTEIRIFFGGAREWERFDLEFERRVDCDE